MRASKAMRWTAVATALAAATTLGAALPASANTPESYVSLGDSYTSAPLVQPVDPSASVLCGRSLANYPHLTAQALGLTLTDMSCGGATVQNMTQSQYPGVAPQFSGLTSSTNIVTMGIGVNDSETFLSAFLGCDVIDLADGVNVGTPCEDTYGSTFANNIAADAPNIAGAIQQIHTLSPQAKVFVIGYPDILPQQGTCWPSVPLTDGDVQYLNGIEHDLNTMLQAQAGANNATFVDTYTSSVGHDACRPESTRWVEPLIPGNGIGAPVHPNAAGEAATASLVEAAITSQG